MRALGIDLGSRRIGVAISDQGGRLATPLTTIERTGAHGPDHRAIAALVTEWEAGLVVVGLPRSLDGTDGPAAEAVRAEVDELAVVAGVDVELADERFSTVMADRLLAAGGRRGRARRAVVDQTAAAVILQGWLDARAATRPTVEG